MQQQIAQAPQDEKGIEQELLKLLGKEPIPVDRLCKIYYEKKGSKDYFGFLNMCAGLRKTGAQVWSAFLDKPVYYREGHISEQKLTEKLSEAVSKTNYENQVLEAFKHSEDFQDLYESLKSYDDSWTELRLVKTLENLLDRGMLDKYLTPNELAYLQAAKRGPISAENIMSSGDYGSFRLVDLGLLTKVCEEPQLYTNSFCAKLEDLLNKKGIGLESLLDCKPEAFSEEQIKQLETLGILKQGAITQVGKNMIAYLSKCSCKFDSQSQEKNQEELYEHWSRRALEAYSRIEKKVLEKGIEPDKNLQCSINKCAIGTAAKTIGRKPYCILHWRDARTNRYTKSAFDASQAFEISLNALSNYFKYNRILSEKESEMLESLNKICQQGRFGFYENGIKYRDERTFELHEPTDARRFETFAPKDQAKISALENLIRKKGKAEENYKKIAGGLGLLFKVMASHPDIAKNWNAKYGLPPLQTLKRLRGYFTYRQIKQLSKDGATESDLYNMFRWCGEAYATKANSEAEHIGCIDDAGCYDVARVKRNRKFSQESA